MIWTILDENNVAINYEDLPEGIRPATSSCVPIKGPISYQYSNGQWIEYIPIPKKIKITSVTPRQARLALLEANLLSNVENYISQLSEQDQKIAKIEWEYAITIERNSNFLKQITQALNLTEEDIDNLFNKAITF